MVTGKRNLTEGNIKKQLVDLTWPMLLGSMGMVVFNLVDTFFVGRLGVHQLAAMSFSFPVIMFINSLALGVGMGTSSLISRNIIHTERGQVKMMASRAILLGVMIVMIFVIAGIYSIRPLFSSLGAANDVLGYVVDYMRIWYFGVPFVVIPMIGNNIVRATGDTFTPGMIMLAIAIVNGFLDPLLIFGIGPFPEMGIKGAALATVLARAIGLITILVILIRHDLISVRLGRIKEIFQTWRQVLYVAGPAALSRLIIPLSVGFITRILASFGKEAVAAFGVASRVEMFAMMLIMALGSVMLIFTGQNLSKHRFDRIRSALRLSMRFSIIWGIFIYIILLFAGYYIASAFTADRVVIDIAKQYFLIIGASYGLQGLGMLSASSFNGLNKPLPSAFFSALRMLVIYVPLAWIGSHFFEISGVFWAGITANITFGVLSYWYLVKTVNRIQGRSE
ncbi:MAG: MATE family efflux transporter [Bacteroidales bacterium]